MGVACYAHTIYYDIQPGFLAKFDPADLRGKLQTATESSFTIDDITMM
ncbi:MAG: hypothetical protein H6Q23_282, partial [Bacteroidetes bacterium]|nr:hypothetical protein [Bacteroidota bacterium]